MSNSVVFLLIAVGLSALGTLLVWLHGRPRRPRSSVEHFNRSLRALSHDDVKREAPSGVVLRPSGAHAVDAVDEYDTGADYDAEVVEYDEPEEIEAPAARVARPSPRPMPRPRPERPTSEGTRPGS